MNKNYSCKSLFLRIAFVFCVLQSSSQIALADHRSDENKITIVADNWCPFTCADNAKKQGILIDIAREAFSRHGIEVEYKIVPWSRAIIDSRAGKYTAIAGASPEEAPDFIYPALPQAVSHLAFYTLNDNPWRYDYHDNSLLEKISFGAVADYSYNADIDSYIAKHIKDSAKVQLLSGENALEMNIKKLLAKHIDAILEEDLVIRKYLAKNNLSEKIRVAGVLQESTSSYLFVSFSPHEIKAKQYAMILDQEMLKMLYSGRITEIVNDYKDK